jgi:hypothetical protein
VTTRRRVALPETDMLPRVGKIRLGIKAQSRPRQDGTTVLYPQAVDYFVVDEDESGITSAVAAAGFHEVYPGQPRSLRVMLPGQTADDVLEGAWRLYGRGGDGGGRLLRKCDGTTCDRRTATGGWEVDVPCVCQAEGIPEQVTKKGKLVVNSEHCALRWTLNVLLPDVPGVGVWQIDTGSQITVGNLAASLRMLEQLNRGRGLWGTEAELRLVPQTVSPEGQAKTVYVLDLAILSMTPRQALEGTHVPLAPMLDVPDVRVALPPSSLDDARDEYIQPDDVVDAQAAAIAEAALQPPPPPPEVPQAPPPASPPVSGTTDPAMARPAAPAGQGTLEQEALGKAEQQLAGQAATAREVNLDPPPPDPPRQADGNPGDPLPWEDSAPQEQTLRQRVNAMLAQRDEDDKAKLKQACKLLGIPATSASMERFAGEAAADWPHLRHLVAKAAIAKALDVDDLTDEIVQGARAWETWLDDARMEDAP